MLVMRLYRSLVPLFGRMYIVHFTINLFLFFIKYQFTFGLGFAKICVCKRVYTWGGGHYMPYVDTFVLRSQEHLIQTEYLNKVNVISKG